ncbi:MAG: hypothetical protein LUD76_10270 [Alistipes sp.]|nr:hypothetical protein [Alistipes sp.]
MTTCNHDERKTYLLDRPGFFRLYLNEKRAKFDRRVGPEELETVKGYSYTGPEPDGATIIAATAPTYAAFVTGMIRLRYTADDELALLANKSLAEENPDAEDSAKKLAEWSEYQAYRAEVKACVRPFFPETEQEG